MPLSPRVQPKTGGIRRWSSLFALAMIGWVSASFGQGLEQSRWFDIPASPMESALLVFSEQAGVQILVDARLTQDLSAPAVSGYYPTNQVLHRLIRGSELKPRVVARNTVVLSGPVPGNHSSVSRLPHPLAPLPGFPGID